MHPIPVPNHEYLANKHRVDYTNPLDACGDALCLLTVLRNSPFSPTYQPKPTLNLVSQSCCMVAAESARSRCFGLGRTERRTISLLVARQTAKAALQCRKFFTKLLRTTGTSLSIPDFDRGSIHGTPSTQT